MTSTSTTRARSGTAAALGALSLMLTLAACGSQVAGPSGGGPPLLRIGTGAYAGAEAVASGGSATGDDLYPLDGTLPTGPATAAVHRYGDAQVPAADVAALATALGVDASPVRHAHGWEVTSTGGVLRVRDGGAAWSFSRRAAPCPAYSVDVDSSDGTTSAVGCAISSPAASGSTTPVPPAPTDAAALSAAAPVLAAVGLGDADPRLLPATQGYGVRTVVVDPVVAGLPTSGVRTLVDVDDRGLLGALGVLSSPSPGDSYPIITAAAALDLLRAMPQPELGMPCVVGEKCPGVGPHVVTGARLGLTMAYDGGAPVLVPAWLFTVRDSDDPAVVVAVERKYLADPVPTGGDGGSAVPPSPATSGGSEPGSSGAPDSPVPVPPGGGTDSPPVVPAPGLLPVQSVTLGRDGRTLVLGGVGGTCSEYAGSAAETRTTVTVSITQTPPPAGQVCDAMAKEFTVTVVLDAPWDGRTILDGATGATLRLS